VAFDSAGQIGRSQRRGRDGSLGMLVDRLDADPLLLAIKIFALDIQSDHIDRRLAQGRVTVQIRGHTLAPKNVGGDLDRVVEARDGVAGRTGVFQPQDPAGDLLLLDGDLSLAGLLDLQLFADQFAVKALLDGLWLGIEPLSGNFHRDFDLERHAVFFDLDQRRFRLGGACAGNLPLLIERLGHYVDQFPGTRFEATPGMMFRCDRCLALHFFRVELALRCVLREHRARQEPRRQPRRCQQDQGMEDRQSHVRFPRCTW
jgi:hypothetical protein